MFLWYLLSVFSGLVLGSIYAIIFYKGNNFVAGKKKTYSFGLFFLRYMLLFAAFWVLFYTLRLNIYFGIASFFFAYWGVLLKVTFGAKKERAQ